MVASLGKALVHEEIPVMIPNKAGSQPDLHLKINIKREGDTKQKDREGGWMKNGEIEVIEKGIWLRGPDLNRRPSGYEPDELPSCSTP
ncbi:hypothetical protein, partial [Aeromonas hydrophila]|uniref:hypothetical protein n=1 Tax=Aeromonas hydrophila TaxID=644 RepID=UPI003987D242